MNPPGPPSWAMNAQNIAGPSSRPAPTYLPAPPSRQWPQPPPDIRRNPSHSSMRPNVPSSYGGRNRHFRGQRDSVSHVSTSSTSNLPAMASKSSYPSTHSLGVSHVIRDDDSDVRSATARMSAMSVRSATTGSRRTGTAPLRMDPKAGRFHLVNGNIVGIHDDSSDDEIEAVELPVHRRRHRVATQSARKTVTVAAERPQTPTASNEIHMSSPGTGLGEDIDTPEPVSPHRHMATKAARKTQIIVISSDSEPEIDDPAIAFHAFASHIKLPIRLQRRGYLPFLRRNLRHSFLLTCRNSGMTVQSTGKPKQPIEYVYRYKRIGPENIISGSSSGADTWSEYRERISEWRCPFCDLLGALPTETMLRFHLTRDHKDVASTDWIHLHDGTTRLVMSLLPPPEDEDEDSFSDDESVKNESVQDAAPLPPAELQNPIPAPEEPLFYPDADEERQESETVDTVADTTTIATSEEPSLPDPVPTVLHGFRLKHELDLERLRARTSTEDATRPPRTGITETGELIPPPKNDLHGPAAEPPLHSCRPGGPRIYDLLNDLSLEPFGILAWSIVDREEEIYELSDVRDDDKVMLALWNRWIMLNRVRFTFHGYRSGVEAFIDEYYVMIHRAAGWASLRSFLLVLTANRFLNIRDVLKCLEYYEKKVKMQEWYKPETSGSNQSTPTP